jgi:hypothetical protein
MACRHRLILFVAAFLPAASLQAQERESVPTPAESPSTADPEVVRLHLMDGSMIAGKLSVKEIEIETKFGTLKVPIESIRSFTPGLASHPELGKQVYSLIDKLGSADYDERELAQKELQRMGEPVRPELEKHAADGDKERRERIKALLEELDEAGEDEEAEPRRDWLIPHDAIETSEFTAIGKIVTPQFSIDSKYGPLTIKLSDVRRGERSSTKKANQEKNVKVEGANLVQRGMKETGIRVERGDKIVITAEGTITMTPWGNGVVSSPDGGGNFGWLVQGSLPGGMLVATIGNNTQYLKVGSRATIRAPKSGNLRLGVAMQQDYANQEFPGGYDVKIVVERK